VHDIERMQGFVTNLAVNKGKVRDEIIRGKERSRKTMECLKRSRQVEQPEVEGEKKKMATSNLVGTVSGTMNSAFVEGSPVDVLLFGEKKKGNIFTASLGMTSGSESNASTIAVIAGLRHLIKVCDITKFAISTVGADGSRLYTMENAEAAGGLAKMSND
jgi:hypothetical protein